MGDEENDDCDSTNFLRMFLSLPQANNTKVQPIQQPAPQPQPPTAAQANIGDGRDAVMQKTILSGILAPTLTTGAALEPLKPSTLPAEENDDTENEQSDFLSTFLGLPSVTGLSFIPHCLHGKS